MLRLILLHKVPKLLVSSDCDNLELVLVPEISENALYVALIHAECLDVYVRALLTDEGAKRDVGVSALILGAVDAELVEGVL